MVLLPRLRQRPAAAAHPVDPDLLAGRGQGRQGRDRPVRPGRPALHVEVPVVADHRSGAAAAGSPPGSAAGAAGCCSSSCCWRWPSWRSGASDRQQDLGRMALLAPLVAFLSASQDIVIDAYRVELLEERQQGAGAAAVVIGYRVAMLLAGAGALVIAEFAGWFWAYAAMAGCLVVGMVTVLLAPRARGGAGAGAGSGQAGAWLKAGRGRAVRRLPAPQRSRHGAADPAVHHALQARRRAARHHDQPLLRRSRLHQARGGDDREGLRPGRDAAGRLSRRDGRQPAGHRPGLVDLRR